MELVEVGGKPFVETDEATRRLAEGVTPRTVPLVESSEAFLAQRFLPCHKGSAAPAPPTAETKRLTC